MIQTRSRRPAWPALLLAGALLVGSGLGTVALGQDKKAPAEASPVPEVSAEPTPEPTPYPEFDPSSVTIRTDLFVDDLAAAG